MSGTLAMGKKFYYYKTLPKALQIQALTIRKIPHLLPKPRKLFHPTQVPNQSALYWLFPKPIPPSPSHSTASIIMVHWLLPSQGFVVFCLFSPPDKLPPHLILGDFPWVRFEVLCGFVKTSDGRQHFNFIPFPHQPKFCSAGLSFMIFHSGSPCGALPHSTWSSEDC